MGEGGRKEGLAETFVPASRLGKQATSVWSSLLSRTPTSERLQGSPLQSTCRLLGFLPLKDLKCLLSCGILRCTWLQKEGWDREVGWAPERGGNIWISEAFISKYSTHGTGVGALLASKIDATLKLQWKRMTWRLWLRASVEGETVWINAFLGLFPNST